jgi:hypothetical protein
MVPEREDCDPDSDGRRHAAANDNPSISLVVHNKVTPLLSKYWQR